MCGLLLLSQVRVCRFLVSPLGHGRDPHKLKPAAALCHTSEAREMAFLVLLQLAAAGGDDDTSDSATPWLVAEQFMLALSQSSGYASTTPVTPVTPPYETQKLGADYTYVATSTVASSDLVDVDLNIDIGDWDVRIKDLTQSALGYTGLKNQALTVRRSIFCFVDPLFIDFFATIICSATSTQRSSCSFWLQIASPHRFWLCLQPRDWSPLRLTHATRLQKTSTKTRKLR